VVDKGGAGPADTSLVRRSLLAAAMLLTVAALAAPTAHARPASEIAGVALHPWMLHDGMTRERVFTQIADTGAKWVRIDVPWAWVEEHSHGHADWHAVDNVIRSAEFHGLKPIGIVAYTPEWASPTGDQWTYPDPQPFEEYFAALLRHYPEIQAWELWNEPNFERFSKPSVDPAGFVRFLRSARKVRDAVGSHAKLISGGVAPGGAMDIFSWVDQIALRGGLNLIDGLGVHPYSGVSPDDTRSWMMQLEALHRRLGKLGRPDLPLWLTEYGAPSISVANGYGPPLTEAQQADRLRKAFALATRFDWIENLTWYEFQDEASNSGDPEDNFGMVRGDLTPKPAYHAFREVVAGATVKLRPKLTLASRFSQARVRVRAKATRRHKAKRGSKKKVRRRLVNRIAVTGHLVLPGTPWPMASITALLPRRDLPPKRVTIVVKEGYFWARFEGPALTSGTVELQYGGSTAYVPVTTRAVVATTARAGGAPRSPRKSGA
jgi:polysaccharide biosynthesis protein PslG